MDKFNYTQPPVIEMMDLHQLSYCNAADENVFTRILEKRPDILLVNTYRLLHCFPRWWNVRPGYQRRPSKLFSKVHKM